MRYFEILKALDSHKVECIVVGGVAATLMGAPVNTFDVDFVHCTRPENVERLMAALSEMDAVYRMQPERRLRPTAGHLSSRGHQLLVTKWGPVDFLGMIGRGRTYGDLAGETVTVTVRGLDLRVLDLPAQIAVKEELGGAKDLAMLPILRATLQERQKR